MILAIAKSFLKAKTPFLEKETGVVRGFINLTLAYTIILPICKGLGETNAMI